jgi:3-isopropylmalate/(R)-2-methylmalate dehydratase large subunit
MGKTLFEKIWDKHIVKSIKDGPEVIYIDKHFIHEVTSPQAFAGIEKRGLSVFRPQQTVATNYQSAFTDTGSIIANAGGPADTKL